MTIKVTPKTLQLPSPRTLNTCVPQLVIWNTNTKTLECDKLVSVFLR